MSSVREQALLDAPAPAVWELVGNPQRYPEWWPRVSEVQGASDHHEGGRFVMVTHHPLVGRDEPQMLIDGMEELHEIRMHCTISGMLVRWRLTEAQGGTFVDAEFGMDPVRRRDRVIDLTVGKRFFRRWLDEAIEGLRGAAETGSDVASPPSAARSR